MCVTPTIRRVAAVLFDGFTGADVYGPVQAFASCRMQQSDGRRQPLFELFSMAEQVGIVKPGQGPGQLRWRARDYWTAGQRARTK